MSTCLPAHSYLPFFPLDASRVTRLMSRSLLARHGKGLAILGYDHGVLWGLAMGPVAVDAIWVR